MIPRESRTGIVPHEDRSRRSCLGPSLGAFGPAELVSPASFETRSFEDYTPGAGALMSGSTP